MLKHTLILPETDGPLAERLLTEAIDALDVVLMLVLGADARCEEIVGWADQLCNKTQLTATYNLRRVVWIRDPTQAEIKDALNPILGKTWPVVAVLNFHDALKDKRTKGQNIDPLELELMFLEGQKL